MSRLFMGALTALITFTLAFGPAFAADSRSTMSPRGNTVFVGNKPVEVVGESVKRRSIMFVNPSLTRKVYLVPANQEPAVGHGIPIPPEGFWVAPYLQDGSRVSSAWKAVAGGEGEVVPLEVLEFF